MRRKLPDVEPLSEQAWSRIERGVLARLDAEEAAAHARSRRFPVRSALALVLAGAAAAIIGVAVRGRLVPVAQLNEPSLVVTAEAGTHIAHGGAALDVGPHSQLLVSGDDDHGILVVLDHGLVECEVAPRQGRPPVIVQAGDVHVRVVGTRFSVRRDGMVTVEVSHGTVEVTSHGQSSFVHAGERWPAVKAEAPPVAAPSEPAPAPAPPAPHRTHPAAPSHPIRHFEPPAEQPSPPVAPVTPPPPSARDRYEAAARLEARDPEAAIAIYRELARGEGAWAQNALYAEGRLEADRKHVAEARRLLEEYLRRFPQGGNADDARELLGRLR